MKRGWIATTLLLCALGCRDDSGVAAYERGDFPEAFSAYREMESTLGANAPAPILANQALAALRAGQYSAAEASAEKAVVRGGRDYEAFRLFVFGAAAYARAEASELLSARVEAGPIALDAAIVHAEDAARFWQSAVLLRESWPKALRNAERALAKAEALRRKRDEAKRRREGNKENPLTPPPEEGPPQEEERALEAQLEELTTDQLSRLLQRLDAKEQEKKGSRRDVRNRATREGARSW